MVIWGMEERDRKRGFWFRLLALADVFLNFRVIWRGSGRYRGQILFWGGVGMPVKLHFCFFFFFFFVEHHQLAFGSSGLQRLSNFRSSSIAVTLHELLLHNIRSSLLTVPSPSLSPPSSPSATSMWLNCSIQVDVDTDVFNKYLYPLASASISKRMPWTPSRPCFGIAYYYYWNREPKKMFFLGIVMVWHFYYQKCMLGRLVVMLVGVLSGGGPVWSDMETWKPTVKKQKKKRTKKKSAPRMTASVLS